MMPYISKYFVITITFLVTLLVAAKAPASQKPKTINVVTEYITPYQIKNDDGSLGGFATEVVNALFAITGDQPQIDVMPWARAYAIAQSQPNTLIYSIARTDMREPLFHWVGSLTTERLYFWGLKTQFVEPIHSIEQLKPYRIAASRKSNAEQYLIANHFSRIYPLVVEEQTMKMLYRDRVDLIVGTEQTFKARAKMLNFEFDMLKKIIEIPELHAELSLAFSLETEPEIIERFRLAYQQLVASGQLAAIQNKWDIPNF